jgi:preprotein translocase subunit SecG
MSILIGLLTAILVLNCLFLILLILIQLPKKEAGAGVAFGGGATEALFGAGSGTVLTKVTKYCAGFFMGMALLLSILNAHHARSNSRSIEMELERSAAATTPSTTAPAAPVGESSALQPMTTNLVPAAPAPTTNAAPATNDVSANSPPAEEP